MTARSFKMALKKLGWSQRTFAREIIKVNERTVRRWVKGDSAVPPSVVLFVKTQLAQL